MKVMVLAKGGGGEHLKKSKIKGPAALQTFAVI